MVIATSIYIYISYIFRYINSSINHIHLLPKTIGLWQVHHLSVSARSACHVIFHCPIPMRTPYQQKYIYIYPLVNDHIAGWNIPIFNRIHTLPETNSSHLKMDGLEDKPFLLGQTAYFQRLNFSFREGTSSIRGPHFPAMLVDPGSWNLIRFFGFYRSQLRSNPWDSTPDGRDGGFSICRVGAFRWFCFGVWLGWFRAKKWDFYNVCIYMYMNNTDICIINKSKYLSIYICILYIYMFMCAYIHICFGFYGLPIHLIAIYPKIFVTVAAKETKKKKNSLSMGSTELVCRQKRPREQPGLQSFTKPVSLYWLFHRDPYNGSL